MAPIRCFSAVLLPALALCAATFSASPSLAQQAGGGRVRDQDVFISSNVLTPGETDSWPLTARENETVILGVTSDAFDPGVELVAPGGKVIAENDDIRPGVQDAMLLARLPGAGDYIIHVKSFKKAAGGEYELSVRRFVATDTPLGARAAGVLGDTLAQWRRFPVEAGQTIVVTARSASFAPGIQLFAPDGEELEARGQPTGLANTTRAVFRALKAGTYHARIAPEGNGSARDTYTITIAAAHALATTIAAANAPRSLEPGGLDIWKFDGKAGELVELQAQAPGAGIALALAYIPPVDAAGEPIEPPANAKPFVVLPSDPKSTGDVVALINTTGSYQISVLQPIGLPVQYTLATSRPLKMFGAGNQATGTLRLGGADYWLVDGTAGQIVQIRGESDQFDAVLELYGPKAERIAENDDGGGDPAGGRNALLAALLVDPGHYLLRVKAYGDGGSGAYTVRRLADPLRTIALGARGDGKLGPGATEIWTFQGRAGQTVIVSARSTDFDTRVSLFGPDATEVASDDDGGEGTDSLLSVRLPLDGAYTVWVSAKSGGGQYSLRVLDAE